jgi:hypothetical protein
MRDKQVTLPGIGFFCCLSKEGAGASLGQVIDCPKPINLPALAVPREPFAPGGAIADILSVPRYEPLSIPEISKNAV